MKINIFSFIVAIVVVTFFSCSKETAVGSQIVDVEDVNIFTETFSLETVAKGKYDLSPAYFQGLNEEAHFIGAINDPYLGESESKLYFTVLRKEEYDNFKNASVDSVVLSVKIDTASVVGSRVANYDFKVKTIDTNISVVDTIYNNTKINVNEEVIGSLSQQIDLDGSTKYFSIEADSVITVSPQLRIKLDNQLGQNIMADSVLAKVNDDFLDKYKGFELSATSTDNSMLSLVMDAQTNATTANNSIEIYYTTQEGDKAVAYYNITNRNFNVFNNDYAQALAAAQIDNGDKTYFYQQSMGGAYGELILPDLSSLKDANIAINSAVIELDLAILDNDLDSEEYPYLDAFYLNYLSDDSEETYIEDIANKNAIATGLLYHNGALNEEKVIFNLRDQIKKYINGEAGNKLFIKSVNSKTSAAKAIFYGSAHSTKSPKLKLTYTKI